MHIYVGQNELWGLMGERQYRREEKEQRCPSQDSRKEWSKIHLFIRQENEHKQGGRFLRVERRKFP